VAFRRILPYVDPQATQSRPHRIILRLMGARPLVALERSLVFVIYFHDGERVIVIPSKAGMAEDPFWYQNALADPDVIFGGRPFRAEVVTDPASQTRIWALADRFYPPNVTYRALAARYDRTIPSLQLTPQ
jgi:hypothetical protein